MFSFAFQTICSCSKLKLMEEFPPTHCMDSVLYISPGTLMWPDHNRQTEHTRLLTKRVFILPALPDLHFTEPYKDVIQHKDLPSELCHPPHHHAEQRGEKTMLLFYSSGVVINTKTWHWGRLIQYKALRKVILEPSAWAPLPINSICLLKIPLYGGNSRKAPAIQYNAEEEQCSALLKHCRRQRKGLVSA